ncbi:HEAT repeat domain-containing protein [bacterium]|nr:HEAT repeat domain-containing protein [bacterium]
MTNILLLTSLFISLVLYKRVNSKKIKVGQAAKVLFPLEVNQKSHNSITIFSETKKKIIDMKKFINEKTFREYNYLLSINSDNIGKNLNELVIKLKDPDYVLKDKLNEIILQNIDFSNPENTKLILLLDEGNISGCDNLFPKTLAKIKLEISNELSTITSKAKPTDSDFTSIDKLNFNEKLNVLASITDESKSISFVHVLRLFLNENEDTQNRIIALDKLDCKNQSCIGVMENALKTSKNIDLAKHILYRLLNSKKAFSLSSETFIQLMSFDNTTLQSIFYHLNDHALLSPGLDQLKKTNTSSSKFFDLILKTKPVSQNKSSTTELNIAKNPDDLITSMNNIKKYDFFILGKLEKLIDHSNQMVVGKALFLLNCHHGDKVFSKKFLSHEDKKKNKVKKDPVLNNYILNIPKNIWEDKDAVIDFLELKAKSTFPIVKEQVAYTLGNFNSKKSRIILRNLLQDNSSHVNYATLVSITRIGTTSEIPFILKMITDNKDDQNIQIAKKTINIIQDRENKKKFKKITLEKSAIAV